MANTEIRRKAKEKRGAFMANKLTHSELLTVISQEN